MSLYSLQDSGLIGVYTPKLPVVDVIGEPPGINPAPCPSFGQGTVVSFLLFIDESGHDHKTMPYEVRGGVAIAVHRFWKFQQDWNRLERACFGAQLSQYGKEIKGSTLLDKKRFRFASQLPDMSDRDRQREARAFLEAGITKRSPTREEFAAYGQACLKFADGVFTLLKRHDAKLFATMIPRGVRKPKLADGPTLMRKDLTFLLERYYYFVRSCESNGILVMDETDKTDDKRFIRSMTNYFSRTFKGRERAERILPVPFFVASDMSVGIQAADLLLYCTSLGFRRARGQDEAEGRPEIQSRYEKKLAHLQWIGDIDTQDAGRVTSTGIVYIPDPYTKRQPRT